jgi:dTDP-4-dehydrorhamnose 3,5-epimerase
MREYLHQPQLVHNKAFYDHRGIFVPLSLTSHLTWIQSSISVNPNKFTFRGLHFQSAPFEQSKLIKVIDGNIIDFIIDLDEKRNAYLKVQFFNLNAGDELYVPKGFAHGFLTLQENTIIQYLVDNTYSPDHEGIINWKHFPEVENKIKKFILNENELVIGEKDLRNKNFNL